MEILAQPEANARRPGAIGAPAQPGIAENDICSYFASVGRAGAGHTGQVGACGRWAQPARIRIPQLREAKARTMWVIYLEMGLALAVLILIVWWTRPVKRAEEKPKDDAPR